MLSSFKLINVFFFSEEENIKNIIPIDVGVIVDLLFTLQSALRGFSV